jgi:transposase-like protein
MATGKNQFKEAHFHDEDAARAWFESARWPDGPACPHCGSLKHYANKSKVGVYRCGEKECRKDFTVMTKSVMERSHAKLTQWAAAFCLYAASRKGFTAMQLQRHLGCEYNTAWFLHHRVMEAMRRGGLDAGPMMGGPGKVVEADEAYHGKYDVPRERKTKRYSPLTKSGRSGPANKRAIISLVDRSEGKVRSFHVPTADAATVAKIVRENVHAESRLHTDESNLYKTVGKEFAAHETVHHAAKEYVRGDVTTNTVEGYFGIFKRGMKGNYQHCAEKNLHRYLAEFDFRYNTRAMSDGERAVLAIQSGVGKRLTYRQPN